MTRSLWSVLLIGCGRFGFDSEAVTADAVIPHDAVTALNGGFADPIAVGGGDSDPQVSADGRELWVANGAPQYDLGVGTRGSRADAFGARTVVMALNSTQPDTDPALSADGLVLMFSSQRSGVSRMYEARRPDLGSPFDVIGVTAGFELVTVTSLDLGPDGNIVFFVSGDFVLRRATRPDRASPFGSPEVIPAPMVGWPTVSPDELLLFGNRPLGLEVVWASRAAIGEPFVERGSLDVPAADCMIDNTSDPDITPDGNYLVVRCPILKLLSRQ